jgi:hypothetical protein
MNQLKYFNENLYIGDDTKAEVYGVRQSVNKPKYFKEILYIVDEPKAEISGL